MDQLRKPFLIAGTLCMLLAVCLEFGAQIIKLPDFASGSDSIRYEIENRAQRDRVPLDALPSPSDDRPPGYGVPSLGFLDVLLLTALCFMSLAIFVSHEVVGRVQSVSTLVISITVLTLAFSSFLTVMAKLFAMVGLLVAAPFGTIFYLILYGFFARGVTAAVLATIMTAKLATAGLLILAHQRFLQQKSLVLLILTSLLANLVVSFLHGIVPGMPGERR